MAAQGEDPFLHHPPGQLVKVRLPDGRVVGGEVVDPARLSKADKAALEVKPAGKGPMLSVCVRQLQNDKALVVVENHLVEPVLTEEDADGAENHRALKRQLRDKQRGPDAAPDSRRASGRSSGSAPARQPAPAKDKLDLLAVAVAGAAASDAAPSDAPPPLLRPKAKLGEPFDLVPPPAQPHPAAGTPPRAKRKRDAADAGAPPPSKVAAVTAAAAPGAAGAAAEERRPTRATAGGSAPEAQPQPQPQPSAKAPPAALKGKVAKPQAATKQRPPGDGQPVPLPASPRRGAPRQPAAHGGDARGRGRGGAGGALGGRASRSTSRSRLPAPAAQAAAAAAAEPAAEPDAVPLQAPVVPRKQRSPRRSRHAATPVAPPPHAPPPVPPPAAAPPAAVRPRAAAPRAAQPAPAPPAPAPPAAPPAAEPPAAMRPRAVRPRAAQPPAPPAPEHSAPAPLAAAPPPEPSAALQPSAPTAAAQPAAASSVPLAPVMPASSQPAAVAVASILLAVPSQFTAAPGANLLAEPPRDLALSGQRTVSSQYAAAATVLQPSAGILPGSETAAPPAADAPRPEAGQRRGGPANKAAPLLAAAQQPAGAATAPLSAGAAQVATGAGGAGALGGAAGTASGLAAISGRSSGSGGTGHLRHNALALALHEKGGSASLAEILPRFRELAGSKYGEMSDKEVVEKLFGIGKECAEIAHKFKFNRATASCALTSPGETHAKRVLAGDPAALRHLRPSAGPKRSSAVGMEPVVKRLRPLAAKTAAPVPEPGRGVATSLLLGAMEAARAEAAANAKQYSRPLSLGAGVAACHQCGMLTLTSGRSCCFASPGSPACGAAYCEECLDTCYPSLTLEALARKCPKCSDTCICKVCCSDERWKQPPAVPPSYPAAAKEHARYLLRLVKGSLLKIHLEQERELACAGYDAVPMMEEREGRITCDLCKTAIADMFYGCVDSRCGAEYCIKCVDRTRTLHPRKSGGAVFPSAFMAGAEGGAGAAHDTPMPDAPAQFVMPRLSFDEDTPAALDELGLPQVAPLKLEPSPELSSTHAIYMSAMTNLLRPHSKLEYGCRLCPCIKHGAGGSAASCAVLLLQRRLPRTFIPRLLRHHAVKDLPEEALPPRCDTGSQDPPREALPCPWCARIAEATACIAGKRDLRTNPNLRRAAYRGQPDDWLWTPAFEDVDPAVIGPERYLDACAHFQWHWRRRQFPIVRNVHSRLDWGPGAIRTLLDRTADSETGDMEVLICRSGNPARCSPKEFIDGYSDLMLAPVFNKSEPGDMLKLKDWPPQQSFSDTVPRQYVDFINILPFQEYTNMGCGALNMAHTLPKSTVPPDLGPKTYIAYGREPEQGANDSVTRLHQDMSDAVNVLMHSARADERLVQAESARRRSSAPAPAPAAAAGTAAAPAAAAALQLLAPSAAAPVAPRFDEFYEHSSLGPAAIDLARRMARGDDAVSKARVAAGVAANVSTFQDEPAKCFVVPNCTPVPLPPAGARWETFRREDTATLSAWLMKQAALHAASNQGDRSKHLTYRPVCKVRELNHAIHNQAFFLTDAEVKRLANETGVHAWTFMQYDHEAVFIPAGCPHQVRNLRSCIKVALDFVSPEAAREVLVLSDEFAGIANEEKLQSRLMLLHAAKQAADLLDTPDR